jgi:hypothetical protein
MYLAEKCVLDLNQLQLSYFRIFQLHRTATATTLLWCQETLGAPHAGQLLKDNFAPDPNLLLCCAVVKTLYVKNTTPELLHSFPGYLFHHIIVFSGLIHCPKSIWQFHV